MSTKDNFVKALKELTGFDDNGNNGNKADITTPKIEPVSVAIEAPVVDEPKFQPEPAAEFKKELHAGSEMPKPDYTQFSQGEQTSIPSGMTIIGNVESSDRLQILGKIEGDVSTTGDAVVTGLVIGKVAANNISLQGAGVRGDIVGAGDVTIERDAKVIGNVSANNLKLDGRIKGNIKVGETADLTSGALVIGDIETGYISTSRGTKIKGNIITKRSDEVDGEDFDIEE